MFVLPFDRKIDWKKPPIVVLSLVVVNVFILYFLQAGDDELEANAVQYYFNQSLDELEIPAYQRFLGATANTAKLTSFNQILREVEEYADFRAYIPLMIDIDFTYHEALQSGYLPGSTHAVCLSLQRQRGRYLQYYDDSVLHEYALRPALVTLKALFGHMFLHAGGEHLWGNMIFLLIVGFVVEAVLGWKVFLFAYLLSGLGSAGLDIVIQPDSYNYHLGASGAISGVMGMYAALFGLRKIQFFYYFLFWVDRIKAPAIIMLPVWLLNEVTQMLWVESNVNYLAHIGGLLSGAFVAFTLNRFNTSVDTDYMDAPKKHEQRAEGMNLGIQLMGEMAFDKAKQQFKKVLREHPDDIQALDYLYKITRHQPESPEYHDCAKKIIELSLADNNFEWLFATYQDYKATAKPFPKLSYALYFQIIDQLLLHKETTAARQLMIPLFKADKSKTAFAGLFLRLAQLQLKNGQGTEATQLIQLILKFYPNTQEAESASALLASIP